MTKAEKEKRIVAIQTNLHCTREEAEQVFADDCEVDKMTMSQLNAEMTEEQRKAQKSATKTGTKKPTVYKFDTSKKTAKKDDEKEEFVRKLHEIVSEFTENCEIANANREITFNLGKNSYSLVLTKHKAAK